MFNELSKLLDPNYCAIWLGVIWLFVFLYQILLSGLGVKLRTYTFLARAAVPLTAFLFLKPLFDTLTGFGGEVGWLVDYLLLAGVVVNLAPALDLLMTKKNKKVAQFGFVTLVFLLTWIARWPSGYQIAAVISATIMFAILVIFFVVALSTEAKMREEMVTDIKSWYPDDSEEEPKKFTIEDIPVKQLTAEELEEMGAHLYQEAGLRSLDSVSVKD